MGMILAVAAGGALGSIARYLMAGWIGHLLGPAFPWGVMIVNILGSAVMGALAEAFALAWNANPELRAFLTVGILGGFTTFSSFSLDAVLLIQRGDFGWAAIYILGSVALSLLGLVAGLHIVRLALA
jgi:CrcB protein